MDPTREFFSKLRKTAVTLETEAARLQDVFESRETTARALKAFHEVSGEVLALKEVMWDELAEQKEQEEEVNNFIKACRVMEQRVTKDIHALRTHLGSYGYNAPCDAQTHGKLKGQQTQEEIKVAEEDESSPAVGEDGDQEEDEGLLCLSPPQKTQQLFRDGMQTPQLSDFGLSEMQLKRAIAGAEWCSEVPPMPEFNLPSLRTPVRPTMATTPTCALRMDDAELQTPQMHYFGISEQTTYLDNDFTMDLFRRRVQKPERSPPDTSAPPLISENKRLQTKADRLDTPEPPSLCTPGFKIKKPDGQCFTPEQEQGDPECPLLPGSPSTPELPPFQTPYVKRLVSTKKRAQPDALDGPSDGEHLETPGRGSTSTWQHREEDKPEMPHLESSLGNYLTTKNGDLPKVGESAKVGKDTAVSSLELDRTTQGFSLPRSFQEPSTPEMPDLSSVTQDICKLVLQAQRKNTSTASQLSDVRPESDRHCPVGETKGLSLVSQSEFETLPDYLRCMPLSSLNQAVRNINRSTNGSEGLMTTCTTEELRRISSVGTRAPVYILCLQELKRLKQVEGSASVYQLITAKE